VVAAILFLFMFAASAPSPLYGVYAARWHFSPTTLTAVFGVYALALLGALLVTGSLSDSVGRRPVILAALAVQAVSMMVFLAADGVGWLYVARVLQGLATGTVTGAVAAALIDLQPAGRPGAGALVNGATPMIGLALGGLGAGALVQYGPAPLRLVYLLMLAGFVLLAMALLTVPEPVTRTGAVRLRPRVGVERAVRSPFLAALPCLVATWALGGLYLSLGPSLVLQLQHSGNRLFGGFVVFLLAGSGAAAALVVRRLTPRLLMLAGCVALAAGVAVTILGVAASIVGLFLLGTAVSGAGFGTAFLGAFRTLAALASPSRRGELIAAVYIAAYLAFSLPAVIAGVVTSHLGLRDTAIGYAAVVGALAIVAIGATVRIISQQGAPDA
jgi:MFS family permease